MIIVENGDAPGLAGTYDSVGTVSIGRAGNLRQITNVAPGTGATDAATVGQVRGALDAIAAVATTADNSVQYSDPAQALVVFSGSGGTLLTNVLDGSVSATSSDAVNGSQLFAVSEQVDVNTIAIQANADAIAAIGTGGGNPLAVLYDDASRTGITLDGAGGTTTANVAAGEVSATLGEAVNGSQLFTTNERLSVPKATSPLSTGAWR
ncbi:hypothetical protein [Aurantiacibacter spongiae]|uniref:hypothetical protein n=1 Tax=Aurantiacibacter spongiae TaxID=2488860 RepID=UPI0013154CBD|nr:hypothetical protein [Aurantiacibacter spongiae]